jgi:hypothetical protein
VGFELEKDGGVIAEAEIAWSRLKIVLLMPSHAESTPVWEANDWEVLVAEGAWDQRLIEKIKELMLQVSKNPEN